MKAEYEENDCKVIVDRGEPYLIINLEKFSALNSSGLSHCDFIYISYEDGKCKVLLVELKNVSHTTSFRNILSEINDFLDNKIPQTKTLIGCLLNVLRVRNPNYFGVLVLPKGAIDKLWENYASIVRIVHKFRDSWITSCGNNVWRKEFPQ